MNRPSFIYGLCVFFLLGWAACGGAASGPASDAPASSSQEGALTQAQLENGIGPITEVMLGAEVDAAMAAEGERAFTMKCSACHKMDQRYVGPPLGQVLSTRTPTYIMNMMLNPDEMVKQHPEAKAMLAQYMTPMPNQNVNEEEARAILEYLRVTQIETPQAPQ